MKIIHQIGLTLAELHEEAASISDERRESYAVWLTTRPEVVQELARQIDIFLVYRVKDGAPYGTTGPGTVGCVVGFQEDGRVVFDAHILTVDLDVCRQTAAQIRAVKGPIRVNVAPEWLEVDV